MKLYTYYRSSASYRVRIALALKGLQAEHVPVNLLQGEQRSEAYTTLNPQGLLPALAVEEESALLTQSLAIIEYLEERFPTPALLPSRAKDKARVRALAQVLAADTGPISNLRVLTYLTQVLGLSEEAKLEWIRHWIGTGLSAFEAMLQDGKAGTFCHGDVPGLAECVLIPQLYNANRFGCDLSAYPTLNRIALQCESLPAFQGAHPDRQADKPQS